MSEISQVTSLQVDIVSDVVCPCYHCGTAIQRVEANTRRLYQCPRCQPPSG